MGRLGGECSRGGGSGREVGDGSAGEDRVSVRQGTVLCLTSSHKSGNAVFYKL